MGAPSPQLKRGVFGYRAKSVRSLLDDRDGMFARVQEGLASSEQKVAALQTELETARAELGEVRERADRVEAAEARATELETRNAELETKDAELEAKIAMLSSNLDAASDELERRAERAGADEAKIVRLELELDAARDALLTQRPERLTEVGPSDEDLSAVLGAAETAFTRMIDRARRNSEEQLARTVALRHTVQAEIDQLVAWRDSVQPLMAAVQAGVRDASERISQVPDLIMSTFAPMTDALEAVGWGLDALEEVSPVPSSASSSPEGGRPAEQVIDLEQTGAIPDPAEVDEESVPARWPVWWEGRG